MKQMRSRFRFLALVLVCAFLLTVAVCAGTVLKESGFTLSSLPSLPAIGNSPSPAPSSVSDTPSAVESTISPVPTETAPDGNDFPGTYISPDPEYNTFGL